MLSTCAHRSKLIRRPRVLKTGTHAQSERSTGRGKEQLNYVGLFGGGIVLLSIFEKILG